MNFAVKMFLLLLVSDARAAKLEFSYLRRMSQSSASIPDCTLQTYMVRSKLDCVRRCFSLTSCTWLTYTTLAPDKGSCVCLSSCVTSYTATTTTTTSTTTTTTSPAAVYFKICGGKMYNTTSGFSWLNKTCSSNRDCPADNSVCYTPSSTCLCTPGYYYSVRCTSCTRDCDPSNLRNTFVKFTGGYLLGHDNRVYSGVTYRRCEMMCAADSRCLSFDYPPTTSGCYLSYDTALTSNDFYSNAMNTQDYYQRMCL
ncbi:uncharacterized protein LOC112566776 [Pomacea canaliculata]|uniref:uncharacterized protein LOC112566776 n=1 Tax=Pomacea canaliculata TaxID=400727 RepID=UPI000D730B94|nr:uncharacterized protein LOC112566776 [Pomacea canaliculata]